MKEKISILVTDDDFGHRAMLQSLLAQWGYDVWEADDGQKAVAAVESRPFDLVLMDIRMLKTSGIEALTQIKAYNPAIPVILMTAYSSVETAIDALKKGAYDYLTKPLDFDLLKIAMERAMDHTRLKSENRLLKESLGIAFDRQNIIGNSPAMAELLETVALVAPSEATVLISGESGTGKELIAGAIHFNSARKNGPFVKINCAAITETLLESELFGHEKGAFTGADRRKEGRFLQAHHGTLFLDEVAEMSMTMQAKLLRVLQEREITRVGGEKVLEVDVRVIAASNKNLPEAVKQGLFREDLYYRLNVVSLDVPPLRERVEDIPILARHFLDQFALENHKSIKGFTPGAMNFLVKYHWPGNVRELMNTLERSVVLALSDYIDEGNFSMISTSNEGSKASGRTFDPETSEKPLERIEKEAILHMMEAVKDNKSEAARRLGITRKTLHKKLKKYNLPL
jgi:two-component system response regulator HydG